VRAHSCTETTRSEHVPVAEELGEGAVRDAELGEEAHGVDGVTSAAGALRPLPLLPRPGRAVTRRGGGGRRAATVTMPPSEARATAGWEVGAAREGWVAAGVDERGRGARGHEE
jgi:hypothetical protein